MPTPHAVPSSVIDRFGMLQLLREGPVVTTYLARKGRAEAVVVKLTDLAHVGAATAMRLTHEAEVLAQLSDPDGQPFLVGHGVDGRCIWVAQRYRRGETLDRRLAAGALDPDETLAVAAAVTRQLVAVHGHSILHRDIKPANVVVDESGPVRGATLIDFGLASDRQLSPSLQEVSVNAARYCSPEQAGLIDHPVDERSDLYSLGLTLHECLTGRPVLEGGAVGDLLRQHLQQKPLVSDRAVGVPGALSEVIARLLHTNPDRRYQTAEAVLADVEEIASARQRGVSEPTMVIGRHDRRRSLADPGFVGRKAELARLEAELAAAAAGRGRVVLVEGESGSGKSRLLDELARRARGWGFVVLRGRGEEHTASRPFQLFEGVTEDLTRVAAGDADLSARLASLAGQAGAVAAVAPALAPLVGAGRTQSALPAEHGPARSAGALASILDLCGAGSRPALVILDDCQWAEALSSRVLGQWAAGGANARVLVVAAFRSEEVAASSPLRSLAPAGTVALSGLADADIRDLITSMAGSVPAPAVDAVVHLADGNAFMAQAILRGMTESGALAWAGDGWRLDPQAARELQTSRQAALYLVRRLDVLDEPARRLLEAAAVLGQEADVDLAVRLSGLPAAGALPAIDELRRRRILWLDENLGKVRFAHDLLRETVLDRLRPDTRQDLHYRAASHFLRSPERSPYQVAFHLHRAGLPFDAHPHALEAAEAARARHALEEASLYYSIALEGAPGDDARYRVNDGMGEVLSLAGSYGEAERYFEEAARLASSPQEQAAALGKLGEVAFRRGDQEAACGLLEQALRTLGAWVPRRGAALMVALLWEIAVQAGHMVTGGRGLRRRPATDADRLRLRFKSRLAYVYWFRNGRLRCLWAHLREMNQAERLGERAAMAQAYSEHAPAMTQLSWFSRGIAYARRSLELRRELGDVWGQGQSLNFYGVVLYAASRYREAAAAFEEATSILAVTGDRWEMNTGRWHLALTHYRLGQWDQAAAIAADVGQSAGAIGDHISAEVALAVTARVTSGDAPDLDQADKAAERSRRDQRPNAELALARALCLRAAGRAEEAADAASAGWSEARRAGMRHEYVAPLLPWWATLLREAADRAPSPEERRRLDAAHRRVARRAVRLARSYPNNLPHAWRERALARVRRGRLDAARRDFDRSVARARAQGAAWEEATSRRERGRVGVLLGWAEAESDRVEGEAMAARIEAAGRPGRPAPPPSLSLVDRFSGLLASGREIVAAASAQGVLDAAAAATGSLLRADFACAVLVDPDGRPQPTGSVPDPSLPVEVIRQAVAGRRPLRSGGEEPVGLDRQSSAGVSSFICAPVLAGGRVAACLYATHREVEGLFGPEEEQVVAYLAALAGASLEHVAGSEAYFQGLVEHAYDVTIVAGRDGRNYYCSPSVERVLGRRPEEVVGPPQFDLMHPDDMDGLVREWTALLADPTQPRSAEVRFRHRDGSWRWMDLTISNRLDDPNVRGLVLNLRDSTERRRAELEAAAASKRFRLAFDHAPIGMALVDQRAERVGTVLETNEALAAMVGVDPAGVPGRNIMEFVHDEDLAVGRAIHRAFLSGATDLADGEIRLRRGSGFVLTRYQAVLIRDEAGAPDYLIAQLVDITEQRAAAARLLHQALHDPLTGLPNRRLFMQRLGQALARADRLDQRVAVLFLDLDHFKTINDSHGHAIGDQVLVETARRLQELTRTSDTLARLGGDEFVVLVEDLQEVAESRAIAQRIEDALHLPMVVPPGAEVAVGTSIGITISRPGATPASLLRDADTALYRAKARGRGRHEVFDDHLRSVAAGSQRVEGALRAAIDAGRLVALYQPVVSLRTGRATDAHAQLHICDCRGALIGPADFAEVAGEAGLAPTLDAWLVRRACTDLAGWSNRFGSGDLGVAVTLTGRRWDGDELARAVQSALADSGVAPRQLAVEVDELQLAEAADTLPAVFVRLRSLGVRTAIAGFGQGQSALSELRQLPIDYLKLDPAIVAAAGGPDQAVVSAVAELARALGVPAMADGVATEAQAAALREAGCELALGPRFGCRRRNKDLVLPR